MDKKNENSYSTILKRISAFGGVQIFNIVINLIRGKFVALFLGPEGMGISSLLTSSTGTIQQIGTLGVNTAIVKQVSEGKENHEAIPQVLAVSIRLIFYTSLLGALLCFGGAPLLSRWTFGDSFHTISFLFLSVFVFLSIGSSGYLAILQGLGEVKRLSKASLVGGLTGLFIGVPLYYFFGYAGIVPAMIILSLSFFLFYYVSFRKSWKEGYAKFSWTDHRPLVMKMLGIGILLMGGAAAGTLTNYLINTFIRAYGSMDDVGLFQGANSLTNQYVGIVFSALAMDYFPRLSASASDNIRMRQLIARQTEIVSLIVAPIVIILILSAPLIIRILLTDAFISITPLMRWMGLSIMIQAIAYPLGYVYIAKDNKKVYFWMEAIVSNIIWIVTSIVFFYFFGLIGLGIGLVVRNLLGIIADYSINRYLYRFRYDRHTLLTAVISLVLCCGAFLASLLEGAAGYIIMSVLLVLSLIFTVSNLRNALRKEKNIENKIKEESID